ncbi:hypothetical protein DFH11DRAFT_1611657 [Phellopilus nigrolimitatus]|nr:hypothetical protein DFH11DRAFT_1611657 [Phellopilus nigrolimitatus]
MLGMPRDLSEATSDPVPLEESASVVAALFDIVYPNAGQAKSNIWPVLASTPEALARAAEKYDMPGAYGLACRLGWEAEAKLASTGTLAVDLASPTALRALAQIDTVNVLRLQKLHLAAFDSKDRLGPFELPIRKKSEKPSVRWRDVTGNHSCVYNAILTSRVLQSDVRWTIFMYRISSELERCALGDKLRDVIWNESDCSAIFQISYQSLTKNPSEEKCDCGHTGCYVFDREAMIREIGRLLDSLPTAI